MTNGISLMASKTSPGRKSSCTEARLPGQGHQPSTNTNLASLSGSLQMNDAGSPGEHQNS
jgi:hypothetical protein